MLPFVGTQLPLTNLPDYDPAVLRNPYTTAWCGAYDGADRPEGSGSHPGVDVGLQYVPALAVAGGEVVAAKQSSTGFGNHVVLKIVDAPEYGTLFAGYAHLKSLNVAVGDLVLRGEQIGVTGSSGSSTAPHLHFQIDKSAAAFHPYWPFTSAELAAAGLTTWQAINQGFQMERVRTYTLSPFTYLQKYRNFTPPEFSDVAGSFAREAIRKLQLAGVIAGTTATIFQPDGLLDRAVAAKLALLATRRRVNLQQTATPFKDVKSTDWFAPFVAAAVRYKIVSGNPDGTFRPAQTVAHAEILKMLVLAAGLAVPSSGATRFADVPATAWFAPFFAAADAAGWLAHLGSTAAPTQPFTRAAAARLAEHALKT